MRTRILFLLSTICLCATFAKWGLAAGQERSHVLTATSFRLVDEHGILRGLWTTKDATQELTLNDERGEVRLSLQVRKSGEAGVLLFDHKGNPVLIEMARANGNTAISLRSTDNKDRVLVGHEHGGDRGLAIYDDSGKIQNWFR